MPRLFNVENCLFVTLAVASMASNASKTATMTGITTADYVCLLYNNDMVLTTESGMDVSITDTDKLMFTPVGASGAGTAVAQTVGALVLVNPTSGQEGGSW
jgi:hypothetical protein